MGSLVQIHHQSTVRCKHAHLSGRRCAQRVSKKSDTRVCALHWPCKECDAMQRAFPIRKTMQEEV